MTGKGVDILKRFGFAAAALALTAPAFAGEVRFTDDGHAQNPVWSPDGKWVAFEVNHLEGSGVDLFVASVSGGIAKDAIKALGEWKGPVCPTPAL